MAIESNQKNRTELNKGQQRLNLEIAIKKSETDHKVAMETYQDRTLNQDNDL